MKQLIALCSILILSMTSNAQEPDFKDLLILYADANYEKLASEAEKYTEKEKTSKLPAPYFWAAKGYYKISLSGNDDPDYKNAHKTAVKFLAKGIKYDLKYNSGDYAVEEAEFVDLFKLSLYEAIINDVGTGGFKKAYSGIINYLKLTSNPVGAKYMGGACKFNDADKTTARDLWLEGDNLLKEVTSIDSWCAADKNMLKMGVLYSAQALKKGRQEDKARALVGKVSQWFENDDDWEALYDEIVNNVGN